MVLERGEWGTWAGACRRALAAAAFACALSAAAQDAPLAADAMPVGDATPLAAEFASEVAAPLPLPADAVAFYADRLEQTLRDAGARPAHPEFVVLVDRSPAVQALMVWWGGGDAAWRLVGAAPVSTGLPGRFEHFDTPAGLFVHSLENPDFRAEGTQNELGIRGYGRRGARVFDFGWVGAAKGWGDRAVSVMRLQLHATDPDLLEQRLGSAQSKGCIRVSTSLNQFLDRHAILDGEYDRARAQGAVFWVLREDRLPTPWSGRLLVVVDSLATVRPHWSPWPARVPGPAQAASASRP